jgi:glycosyltransferase involved in cell wall biosynthesis
MVMAFTTNLQGDRRTELRPILRSEPRDRSKLTPRPVKVCFISPLGYSLYASLSGQGFGGAEVQFFLLSQALSADPAYSVSVLTSVEGAGGAELHGRLTVIKRTRRGRYMARPARGWFEALRAWGGYWAAFFEMRRVLREINADVYLHAGAGVEVGAYALICRLLRRRFVYVVASIADLSDPYGQVQGPLRWLHAIGVRLAHAVVCRTREQQTLLQTRYRRDSVLIRTGHPLLPPVEDPKTSVLWVGRIDPLKQPEMFLALAERLEKERCVMVAMRNEAHDGLLKTVRDWASELPNLTLHEDVPWSEIGRFFREAKLLVNTSTYEGFPNTFVQAAMHRTPILSWTVDPDGVLARHRIGVCAGGSFDRLVEAAGRLCNSPEALAEHGARALRYASEHHDLNRSVEELKGLAKSLAGLRVFAWWRR